MDTFVIGSRVRKSCTLGIVITVLAQVGGQAHALAAPDAVSSAAAPAAGAADPAVATDEVVVTARRRSESLKDVPVAITAIGGAQLATRSITTDADLQRSVPGLTVRQNFNSNQIAYSIRGQTIDAFSGSRPAVVAYLNDVQIPQGASTPFYDLESVQVLKGPQGTLFGRNATGGAVLFSSTKPGTTLGGNLTATVGNYDLRQLQGAIDVPLVNDAVLFRIAGIAKRRDGYVLNEFTGEHLGRLRQNSLRASLLVRPFAGVENLTMYQYSHLTGSNVGGSIYSAYGCGSSSNGIALVSTAACLYSPALDSVFGVPGAWNAFLAAHPGVPAGGILQALAQQQARGPWRTSLDEPARYRVLGHSLTNTTTVALGDNLSLKNIVGYSTQNNLMFTDLDGTPFPIEHNVSPLANDAGIRFTTKLFSEELQLQGKALDNDLSYIAGFYLSRERNRNFQNFVAFDLTPLSPPSDGTFRYQVNNLSEAVFGQATYDLSRITGIDTLKFTAGVRSTWDTNKLRQLSGGVTFATLGPNPAKKTTNKPSWQVGLEYKPTPQVLLYINQRGSWRSGGFNGTAPGKPVVASLGGNLYLPETTEDVEVGAKYAGTLLGYPAQFNLAIYNQWIHNVQRSAYLNLSGNLVSVTVSVPRAEISGVEADGEISPSGWLRLGGSVAYTNARYTNGALSLFGQSFNYDSYADVPRLTGTAFAQINLPVPESAGSVSLRGDIYAQTKQYISNTGRSVSPNTALPGYHLINGHLDWNSVMQSPISLSLFVTNLTNERYYVGGFTQGTLIGINSAIPGMPRMFGGSASVKF